MVLFWFRRDLRLDDNHGLYQAFQTEEEVLPVFIFDKHILSKLDADDRRVAFIHIQIRRLKEALKALGSDLLVFHDFPEDVIPRLASKHNIRKVFCNEDYSPYSISRDQKVDTILKDQGARLHSFKDHVIFSPNEILKKDNSPYLVYTPYSKSWKQKFNNELSNPYEHIQQKHLHQFGHTEELPSLPSMGFIENNETFQTFEFNPSVISTYDQTRDNPDFPTTTIGTHLRFGTISTRKAIRKAYSTNETWLNELIWRSFFNMILFHYPSSTKAAFKPKYDRIQWVNNEAHFEKWKKGETGYPLVDAGMKELNATGFMHNRVRMVTASFLTKHLLIDWRWGERYFASKLLDFELSSNVGNWQWVAGTGCDAAPYFRIFNPTSQQQKFDPAFKYIKKWIPEFDAQNYIPQIIDHAFARKRALEVYGDAVRP